jgi:formylmethanofuran--tetrahydromethanopterin N-formyltransferase
MQIDDTFAEAFGMSATRLLITAHDDALATAAAQAVTGNASSVIGCNCEAAIERSLDPAETPDGRPGISVLVFAFSSDKLEKALTARVGQNVLTCPTTACFAGLSDGDKRIRIGGQLRYFGDGFQNSKSLGRRRLWRIPVMDGEFLCEDHFPVVKGIGGGNLLICGRDVSGTLKAALQAAEAIRQTPDVIMPFPSGIVRSGSKVGSRYKQLPASTNDKWCPTLRAQTDTELLEDEHCVYEIVIDGLTEQSIANAMSAGIETLRPFPEVTRVSAGNYGGKLGAFHFHLHQLAGCTPQDASPA